MNYCSAHQTPDSSCPLCNKGTQKGAVMRPMTLEENAALTEFTNAELGAVADTPRTDAAIAMASDADGAREVCDLAESMERQLAALRAQLHACVAASQDMHAAQAAELDALRTALKEIRRDALAGGLLRLKWIAERAATALGKEQP